MFEFIKNFWREIFDLTKTWSIRKQMMVCYIIAMVVILILILLLVMLNIYILRFQTVQEIDKTLNRQANDNMGSLVSEAATLMQSELSQVTAIFGLIQQFLLEMENEDTFSLDYLLSYQDSQLPEKCWQFDTYQNKVCPTYSCYYALNLQPDPDTLRSLSRLDNIWPSIYNLNIQIAARYFLYMPQSQVYKIFPGQYISNDTAFHWYNSFQNSSNDSIFATAPYNDPYYGFTITVVYELFNSTKDSIGYIAADIPINGTSNMFDQIYDIKYLTGNISIAYKDGSLLPRNTGSWDNDVLNVSATLPVLWNQMNNTNSTHFFIYNENIYRMNNYWVGINYSDNGVSEISDPFYTVMLVCEENEIMKYRDDSKDKLVTAGVTLISITLICSAITIAVVTILIHYLAKSITSPLTGIIEFTNKINAKATEKDMVTREELEELKEGDDQVAELVRTFKELAGSLITKKEDRIPKPLQISQNRVYPRNELYQKNKLEWKKLIESLPND